MAWLPDGEKKKDIFIRFDTMHERDRHTPHGLCIASCSNKTANINIIN